MIPTSIETIIVTSWKIPLPEYLSFYDRPVFFSEQFLVGTKFLHGRQLAHMDLEPDNVLSMWTPRPTSASR